MFENQFGENQQMPVDENDGAGTQNISNGQIQQLKNQQYSP